MSAFENARKFIYRNARPIDLALWQYNFENGSKEAVLKALSAYQNSDGGFGWGLEADNFNPASLPMGVWKATEYLEKIGGADPNHPIVSGILKYLSSGSDFEEVHRQWLNVVPSNNDCPCAMWWKYHESGSQFEYNPTAALAGFIIRYAEWGSALYEKGVALAKEAAEWFISDAPIERHIAGCFISLYNYCKEADVMPFDGDAVMEKMHKIVEASICRDTKKWGEYMPTPSTFISSKLSPFYVGFEELCRVECEYIKNTQLPDGSFNVPWTWCNDYKEWQVAENWCKSIITMENMLFLREFDIPE